MKANTDKLNMGKRFIPRSALNRLGEVFIEGLRYDVNGETNWKKGVFDDEYQHERLEHALDHLWKWIEGDRSEDHLAKVMWFCATQMELERMEQESIDKSLSDSLSSTNPLIQPQADSTLKGEERLERPEDELYKQENPKETPIEKLLKNLKKTFAGNAGD